jgi:hypothetical protein
MQDIFDDSKFVKTSPDDAHQRVLELEQRIEDLRDYAGRCRKAMQISRAAILGGTLLFMAALLGLAGGYGTIAGTGGFACVIGGFVWLGASKSSGEEAHMALARAQSDLALAIDALGLYRLN